MKLETVDKWAITCIIVGAVIEVVGTIALAVLGVIIANHFIVKFW